MLSKKQLDLIAYIEAISALEAGTIGYMPQVLVAANLPYKKPNSNEFERVNGNYRLTLISPNNVGLPYGSIPRIIIAWIATEVVLKKKREIILGNSMSHFIKEIGYFVSGGHNGSIFCIKDQIKRFFSTNISYVYSDNDMYITDSYNPVSQSLLYWSLTNRYKTKRWWQSKILLNESFYNEIIDKAVPVDMRALEFLRRSPMGIDIYVWLTYRMSYLRRRSKIPWVSLSNQLGSGYGRLRDFKKAFKKHIKLISLIYPQAKFDFEDKFLILQPSPPHVSKYVNKRSYPRISGRG